MCTSSVAPLPGTGNLTGNPLFVNAATGNYRLQAGSPAIDTGGVLAWTRGRYEEAVTAYMRAMTLRQQAFGAAGNDALPLASGDPAS